MGTPDFAVEALRQLVEGGYNVVGVITMPDKPAGRGHKIQYSPVKQYALEQNLPLLQPEKLKNEAFVEALREWKADLQIVVAFRMLPEVVWSMPRLGTVNLHASLLPDYRGAAPINWAVMNGEKISGVSTFLLKHEIDTGNVIFQEKVAITEEMTAGDLHDCLMEKGADLLLRTVEAIEAGDYPLQEQHVLLNGREPIHAPKIFKEDMKIDWAKPLEVLYNHIRGLAPFPAAWTELRHRVSGTVVALKVFKSERIACEHNYRVGEIVAHGGKSFEVYVHGGILRILEVQLAGKKRMTTEEFLRGFRLEEYQIQ